MLGSVDQNECYYMIDGPHEKHTLRKAYLAISYWSSGKVGALESVCGHTHILKGSEE